MNRARKRIFVPYQRPRNINPCRVADSFLRVIAMKKPNPFAKGGKPVFPPKGGKPAFPKKGEKPVFPPKGKKK